MADFLLLLGKLNLAMGAAIILVSLLRRPLRAMFGAPIAYAIWSLVPIAGLASLLPARVAAPPPVHFAPVQYPAAPMSVIGQLAHPVLRITEHLTGQSALVHPLIAAHAAAPGYGTPDYAMLLFAAWVLGAVLMAFYLARLQARFHADMRSGEAGPAVLGFFRPRLVMPDSFLEQYNAPEQAAILAHERVHLARHDARINALAALLRCFCWFNPLIHFGAAWLRIDQELACDATALGGPVSRRDYANALLKSHMTVTALPLGCNWPGAQHPLIDRIALLKRKRPGTARRIAGTGLVVIAATFAGLGAWAAQPPVPAKFSAAPRYNNQIALVRPRLEFSAIGAAHPATTARVDDKDHVIPGHDRLASIKSIGASRVAPISPPLTIASVNLAGSSPAENQPVIAVSQADGPSAPTQAAPVVAGEPAMLAKTALTTIPPVQPKLIADTMPPYILEALRLHDQGATRLQVTLDASGRPTNVAVDHSSGSPRLDDAAIQDVKDNWRWEPATSDGEPVAATILVDVTWDMEDR